MIHTYGSALKGRTRDLIMTNIGEVLIAKSKSYVHNLYILYNHEANRWQCYMYTIEQDLTLKFRCERLCWYDDKHGVDTFPIVQVDPPVVDDNSTVEVPRIQQHGLLRLSSVMDIRYLQLNTPLLQTQTLDRLSG
jgi:hypothetical protein